MQLDYHQARRSGDPDRIRHHGEDSGGSNGNNGGNLQPIVTVIPGISSTDPVPGFEIPPDNGLAANSGYIVQDVNTTIRWTNTAGADAVEQPFSAFFGSLGSFSYFDPRVIYDAATSEFIVSAGATDASNVNYVLLGVSNGANPNDGFNVHSYQFANSSSIDQPSEAADGSTFFLQATVGYPAETQHVLVVDGNGQGPVQEVDLGGGGIYKQVAASGTGDYALAQDGGTITLQHITTAGSIDAAGSVSLGDVSGNYGEQYLSTLGETIPIDAGDSRIYGLALSKGTLWTTFEVTPTSGPDAGTPNVHWAELNVGDPSNIAVIDQGTIAGSVIGAGVGTATGSVGVDGAGDVILNFVASGSGLAPTDYFEVKAADGTGFSAPIAWDSSAGPYLEPNAGPFGDKITSRWGDYSSAIADPNNPHGFYISNEVGVKAGSYDYSSPIAHVVVPSVTS